MFCRQPVSQFPKFLIKTVSSPLCIWIIWNHAFDEQLESMANKKQRGERQLGELV